MKLFFYMTVCLLSAAVPGVQARGVLVASPDGKAGNEGTEKSPLSVYEAVKRAVPGTVIRLRGGRYMLDRSVRMEQSGTAGKPIRIEAWPGEHPVWDGTGAPDDSLRHSPCARLSGDWWQISDLEMCNASGGGIFITGSHIRFERCSAHHNGSTGFNVGFDHGTLDNEEGEKGAYIVFIDCDAYMNYDWWTSYRGRFSPGTHADGFGCKLRSGKGIKFHGCRAWSNSDDNWDLFECGAGVEIVNCWNWRAGIWTDFAEMHRRRTSRELTERTFAGDGNGFKMGGNHVWTGQPGKCDNKSRGLHVLRGSISFGNRMKGIDQNNHQDGIVVENCLCFDNGDNIRFWKEPNAGKTNVFRNNAAFGKGGFRPKTEIELVSEGNSWDLGIEPSREDFVSLDERDASAPRGKDGSLPSRFGRLRPESRLIDRGVRTFPIRSAADATDLPAIPYKGKAPDLGAYELK